MFSLPSPDTMYEALCARDASFEGVFLVCVRTTGIFCKPTCRARKPKRENVEFVASAAEAIRLGYRACKVCRPLELGERVPDWVGDLIARVEREPERRISDAELRRIGVDPARARRWFLRHYGVTFHAWQRAWRLGEAFTTLRDGNGVAAAAHDGGFESESGFRSAWGRLFGTQPAAYSKSEGRVLRAQRLSTPLGPMLAIASERGLTMLEFVDRRSIEAEVAEIRKGLGCVVVPGKSDLLAQIERELGEYFAARRRSFDVPLDLVATPFQRSVWDQLLAIPCGETRSYAEIAETLGRPGGQRAVGRANGQNRIAIVVPCHRVIRSDGELSGYGGGLWRKRWLLEHERRG